MSKYWYKSRRYGSQKPEDFIFLLSAVFVLAIFYPPIRPTIISVWYIYAFAILAIIAIVANKIYHEYKLSKAGMFEIDKMTGEEFEERLRILFSNLGYKAERTSPGKVKPDYGVDLVIEKNGTKTAVQAKCYKHETVKESAIQAVFAGKNYYNCTEAIVVTNNYFTPMAKNLAKVDEVELWNRDELTNEIIKSQPSAKNQSLSFKNGGIPSCPICHSEMVMRSGRYGQFWGCARFPNCKGTINLDSFR